MRNQILEILINKQDITLKQNGPVSPRRPVSPHPPPLQKQI